LRRLEKAVDRVDIGKVFEILRRIGMGEVVKINAMSILARTQHPKLKEVAAYLA